MKPLEDFPYLSSRDFKLSNRLTDEQLQDLCTQIRGRMDNLVSDTPRVSVVFPAYNEEMYLPLNALDTLKTQYYDTYRDYRS